MRSKYGASKFVRILHTPARFSRNNPSTRDNQGRSQAEIIPIGRLKVPAGKEAARRLSNAKRILKLYKNRQPEVISRWWRMFLRHYPNLTIEATGYLNHKRPLDEVGLCLERAKANYDGWCIHINSVVKGEVKQRGRARIYEVISRRKKNGERRVFYIFGDIELEAPLRNHQLDSFLMAFRVLICWMLDIPASKILWPAGEWAERAECYGFVDLPKRALRGEDPAVLEVAAQSKLKCRKLASGLMRLSSKNVPMHLRLIQKEVVNYSIPLTGQPGIRISLGPALEQYFQLMLRKLDEIMLNELNDGCGDGC